MLPSIPTTYTAPNPANYMRGQAIQEDRHEAVIDALTFIAAQRVRTHWTRTWGYYSSAVPAILSRAFNAGAAPGGLLLDCARVIPSPWCHWLIWGSSAEDGTLQFEIDTDPTFAAPRMYEHAHPAAGGVLSNYSTRIAVEIDTVYYTRLTAIDGGGDIQLMSSSLRDAPLTGAEVSQHVPEFATITAANTALSPTGYELCYVGGQLLCFLPPAHFEWPEQGSGVGTPTNGLWVPYVARDWECQGMYVGGTPEGNPPNSYWWTATLAAAGQINEAGANTQFLAGVAADAAWVYCPLRGARPVVVYLDLIVDSQGGSTGGIYPWVDDGVMEGGPRSYLAATPGRTYISTATMDYTLPAATTKLLYIHDPAANLVELRDYDTMQVLTADTYASLGGPTTPRASVGSRAGTNAWNGTVTGSPAIAVLEARS